MSLRAAAALLLICICVSSGSFIKDVEPEKLKGHYLTELKQSETLVINVHESHTDTEVKETQELLQVNLPQAVHLWIVATETGDLGLLQKLLTASSGKKVILNGHGNKNQQIGLHISVWENMNLDLSQMYFFSCICALPNAAYRNKNILYPIVIDRTVVVEDKLPLGKSGTRMRRTVKVGHAVIKTSDSVSGSSVKKRLNGLHDKVGSASDKRSRLSKIIELLNAFPDAFVHFVDIFGQIDDSVQLVNILDTSAYSSDQSFPPCLLQGIYDLALLEEEGNLVLKRIVNDNYVEIDEELFQVLNQYGSDWVRK